MRIIPLSSVSASSVVIILCILASLQSPNQCASTIHPESRIINGENTTEGEFPHQVMALIPQEDGDTIEKFVCGGSILNEDHILIASHCVINATSPTDIYFYAGKHDFTDFFPSDSDKYFAAKVIVHPCFNQKADVEDELSQNDIAIVKLAKPLPLNGRNIRAIKIDQQDLAKDGTSTVAIGWGKVRAGGELSPSILKKTSLDVSTNTCKNEFKTKNKFKPLGQICALGNETFICTGDSGGPLLCDDGTGTSVVCGVASVAVNTKFRWPECHGPGIFIRVYHYRDWIKSVLEGKRNSAEGCIGDRYLPDPELKTTPKPGPGPKPEEPETESYDELSCGFHSYCPSRFIYGICPTLSFLFLWRMKIL